MSAPEQKWLKQHPVIKIGTESDWAPIESIDESGKLQGLSADVISLVEQRLGIKFKIVSQFPWAETLEKAKTHEIDLVSGIVKTPEREQFLNFSKAYVGAPSVIYTRMNSIAPTSLEDLKQKIVAVEDQYQLHKLLIKEYQRLNYCLLKSRLRGVAIFAKACFGHPSPSKRQKLNATTNAFGAPDVLRTCHFATIIVNSMLAS